MIGQKGLGWVVPHSCSVSVCTCVLAHAHSPARLQFQSGPGDEQEGPVGFAVEPGP